MCASFYSNDTEKSDQAVGYDAVLQPSEFCKAAIAVVSLCSSYERGCLGPVVACVDWALTTVWIRKL